MSIYFTADPHFFHPNILKHQKITRPFNGLNQMTAHIITAWNSRVTDDDDIWCLGDFAMLGKNRPNYDELRYLLEILNGRKHLIIGNHEYDNVEVLYELRRESDTNIHTITGYHELRLPGNTHIILSHYPIARHRKWYYGTLHLHGHSHGKPVTGIPGALLDVGVDTRKDLAPYSLEEVLELTTDAREKASRTFQKGE